jgi:hypothetical protein
MPFHRALRIALLVALAACRYDPSHVPIEGRTEDIARLAGTWEGEYSSVESGRTGSITFTVLAGQDTALGDVLMVPAVGDPYRAADAHLPEHREHVRSPELLHIRFVRVDGGILRGELEPYVAPDCRCVVTTVFRGVLTGDRIEGQYVTRGPGVLQEGRWKMVRRR